MRSAEWGVLNEVGAVGKTPNAERRTPNFELGGDSGTGNVARARRNAPATVAQALYARNGLDFEGDLREYEWPNGVIVDRPDCFGIAFATKIDARLCPAEPDYGGVRPVRQSGTGEEWCWFVKVAVGELRKLLTLFPVQLPFISFCRSKSGRRVKTYRMERVLRRAGPPTSGRAGLRRGASGRGRDRRGMERLGTI